MLVGFSAKQPPTSLHFPIPTINVTCYILSVPRQELVYELFLLVLIDLVRLLVKTIPPLQIYNYKN